MHRTSRTLNIIPLGALGLATALVCGPARADDNAAARAAERDAERALERVAADRTRIEAELERAAQERERAREMIERERMRFDALSAEEREKARSEAREELQRTQEELSRMAAKVAELSVRLQGPELERGLRSTGFGRPIIGVVLDEDGERGVRLSAVTPGGPAAEAGLRAGDRIVAVNGKRVQGRDAKTRLDIARELIGQPDEGAKVALDIETGGKTRTVEVAARNMGYRFGAEFDPARLRSLVSPRWSSTSMSWMIAFIRATA